jgi:hypothetical protein
VAEYIRQEHERNLGKDSFLLHKYLHHGLSSQAMVFNLVGPLIVRKDLEPLRVAIKKAGMPWPSGEVTAGFEYDDRTVFNEDSGQPTSIDLAISGETARIFIEAKLVEREFGGCSVFSGGECDGRNPVSYGVDGCYLHPLPILLAYSAGTDSMRNGHKPDSFPSVETFRKAGFLSSCRSTK